MQGVRGQVERGPLRRHHLRGMQGNPKEEEEEVEKGGHTNIPNIWIFA